MMRLKGLTRRSYIEDARAMGVKTGGFIQVSSLTCFEGPVNPLNVSESRVLYVLN